MIRLKSFFESKEKDRVREIDKLIDNIIGLIETYMNIIKIEVQSGISRGITVVVIVSSMVIFLSLAAFFLSIGLAFLLNYLFKLHTYAGFMWVAGFYLFLFLIIFLVRKLIRKRLEKLISDVINEKENG